MQVFHFDWSFINSQKEFIITILQRAISKWPFCQYYLIICHLLQCVYETYKRAVQWQGSLIFDILHISQYSVMFLLLRLVLWLFVYTKIFIMNQREKTPPLGGEAQLRHPTPSPGAQPLAMWPMTSSVSGQESEWHVALSQNRWCIKWRVKSSVACLFTSLRQTCLHLYNMNQGSQV